MTVIQHAHGYVFNDDGRDVWASCTCGWAETGARHGDRRWREYATACAWDAHCASVRVS